MGIRFKVDGKEVNTNAYHYDGGNPPSHEQIQNGIDGMEIPLGNKDVTERLWAVINENTELQQQITLLKYQLESIKRIVAE